MSDTELSVDAVGDLTLVVGWRVGRRIEGGRVEVTEEVAAHLRATAELAASDVTAREPKEYAADAHLEEEEIFVVPADDLEYENDLVAIVRAGTGLRRITAADLPGRRLLFYASVIGNDPEARTAFVRKSNPMMVAGVGRILTRLRQSLTTVEEPVFAFDQRVDLIVGPSGLVISNQAAFEQLFKDLPRLLQHIPEWLADVSAHLPIEANSIAELERRCKTDSRLRRRLQAIRDRGHLANVGLADIRAEAVRQGIDPDSVIVDGHLVVKGTTEASDLLKLLNEDLMTGGLSGERFAVERKARR